MRWRLVLAGVACAGIVAALLVAFSGRSLIPATLADQRHVADAIWAAYSPEAGGTGDALEIAYPGDGTLFPPEIAEPTFRWRENRPEADAWLVRIECAGGKEPLQTVCRVPQWTPSPEQWQEIKAQSVQSPAKVTVLGVSSAAPEKLLSSAAIRIQTSKDEVGAPLFYREVPLPFSEAVKDPSRIRWRFGSISSRTQPPIVLENMPVCGNCHSFSADGKHFGMDVDYANDKGSYVLSPVREEMVLDPGKIITWADYKREDKEPTFGLLSQISPDGKFAVSTVKDRSVFVALDNLETSQLFFPIKGILAIHDVQRKTFASLPGANDPQYVQSNAVWSPDGKYIVFARSQAHKLRGITNEGSVLLTQEECEEFLKEGKKFLFDLYRVPFNGGQGGQAEPLRGASGNGMSNYFPKYSPDGKWIVFCRAKSFMLLQPDSEMYIMPAEGGEPRRLRANTRRMNSWHTWSPNSRWLAFTSKLNGPYSQLFLTHIDEQGESTPPVQLVNFTAPDRAANIPEFVNASADSIRKIREQFLDDHSHVRAADEFLKAGDLKNAERMYRKAIEINPQSAEAHTRLAVALIQVHKPEEAVEHLKTAVESAPKYADLQYFLGDTLAGLGRTQEAIVHFEQAAELKPNNAEAHFYLANILAGVGKWPKAIAHYEQTLRLDPKHAEAHNGLGTALATTGRLPEAIAHYRQAVALKPDLAKARDNLNLALADAEKAQATIQEREMAVKLNPNAADSLAELGSALMKMGRGPEAVAPLERAVQLEPSNVEANGALAFLLATKEEGRGGNPARAVSLAERACQLTGNKSVECLDTLAVAYAAAGRFPDAITAAERAMKLAKAAGQSASVKRIEGRLDSYRAGCRYDGSALPKAKPAS